MGCVVIEHFPEKDFNESDFGLNRDARLDAANDKPARISLNTSAVMAFECIEIRTTRPFTRENKEDVVPGVRIKTSWGQHLVVFDDLPMNFSKAMDTACSHQKINELTTLNSDYWRRYRKQS
ncbi:MULTISPECIES: hypothetical protein [unclassified Methylophaga]|jgi:hypothetical protein|uniref:hypothetical protein n=2 Tax=Methylophaga TaxID=40222 RepID=UPI000C8D6DE0|nr:MULTISPECIES: hypothetical protein [unclassified Methylophaga]MAL51028.1 hypothetical protein [Methylophaga sp.]HBQ61840.1 hypothetical protein [Balneolaceae bacterium]HCC82255.1 hypothetical protein [Methylophaga sp.]|tara:strand:+ start:1973 stop:2338 length:366 start_codon:yes stop_codon:yes gene_type:complete